MNIWVKQDFLTFTCRVDGMQGKLDVPEVQKPMQLLRHAEDLVRIDPSAAYLSDAISNVNRAVDLRLKQIENIYKIQGVEFLDPLKQWDRLEKLGIIRKTFIQELNKVRNRIEHRYVKPPSVKVVQTYIDFCWYYLRSTNQLCTMVVNSGFFDDYRDSKSVYFGVSFGRTWKVDFRGNLPASSIEKTATKNYVQITRARMESGAVLEERRLAALDEAKKNGEKIISFDLKDPYEVDQVYWSGVPEFSRSQAQEFYRCVFELY